VESTGPPLPYPQAVPPSGLIRHLLTRDDGGYTELKRLPGDAAGDGPSRRVRDYGSTGTYQSGWLMNRSRQSLLQE